MKPFYDFIDISANVNVQHSQTIDCTVSIKPILGCLIDKLSYVHILRAWTGHLFLEHPQSALEVIYKLRYQPFLSLLVDVKSFCQLFSGLNRFKNNYSTKIAIFTSKNGAFPVHKNRFLSAQACQYILEAVFVGLQLKKVEPIKIEKKSGILPRSIFIEFFFARNRIWSKVGRCFGSSSQHSIINLKWIFKLMLRGQYSIGQ